jgi:hypothetical protein
VGSWIEGWVGWVDGPGLVLGLLLVLIGLVLDSFNGIKVEMKSGKSYGWEKGKGRR